MRLGAIFQSALTAGPGAYSRGVTTRLNEDTLQRNAEREQAALEEMRRQQGEAARLRGIADVTAATEGIAPVRTFDVAGQKSFAPIEVPEAAPTPAAGLSAAPKYTPMGPATDVQQQVAEKIKAEALRQGLEPDIALRIAAMESTMGANLVNPGSKARGVFQFMPETWEGAGGGDRLDTDLNIKRGVALTMENHKALTKALGRQPTGAELYLALQQGLGGAKALLKNPNMRAVDALQTIKGMTAKRATEHLVKNRIDPNMTAAQVNALFYNKYNAAGGGVRQFLAKPVTEPDISLDQRDWDSQYGASYNPDGTPKGARPPSGRHGVTNQPANVPPRPGQFKGGMTGLRPTATELEGSRTRQTALRAGVQPPTAAPTAESSLIEASASQPVGTVNATKWKQILLDTPGKPGQELAAFTDARAELVRLADNFRQAKLSSQYLEVRAKIKEMDNNAMYLHGMQALQNFADGDPRYLQAVLSESMQRQVEIQPRSDGKFDLYSYEGGKRVLDETGLTPAGLEAMARTRFDAEYNARMAKISDENRASTIKMGEKQFEADLDIKKIGAEATRDIMKAQADGNNQRALERVKAELGGNVKVTMDPTSGGFIVQDGPNLQRYTFTTMKLGGKDVPQTVVENLRGGGGWNSSFNIPMGTGR